MTYVPFRNAHFLAAAVSWAEVLGANGVYRRGRTGQLGVSGLPAGLLRGLQRADPGGNQDGDIRVVTPLIGLKKSEIVRLGVELGAPFHVSWSCYSGETEACGVCESCALRLRAFREAGAVDPIPYAVGLKLNSASKVQVVGLRISNCLGS